MRLLIQFHAPTYQNCTCLDVSQLRAPTDNGFMQALVPIGLALALDVILGAVRHGAIELLRA
jgi:hypothetical protein